MNPPTEPALIREPARLRQLLIGTAGVAVVVTVAAIHSWSLGWSHLVAGAITFAALGLAAQVVYFYVHWAAARESAR